MKHADWWCAAAGWSDLIASWQCWVDGPYDSRREDEDGRNDRHNELSDLNQSDVPEAKEDTKQGQRKGGVTTARHGRK